STHDTKRSEDVRARLNVLSELPREWQKCLSRWNRWNKRHRLEVDGMPAPHRNEEYFLYQTLIGAWPLDLDGSQADRAGDRAGGEFVQRIQQYMTKALHEAKVHTSWINPDLGYDDAVRRFVARILDPKSNKRFLADFQVFQQKISHYGLINSLAQVLLKIAS